MRRSFVWLAPVVLLLCTVEAHAEQTIVFMRHGEKPSGGYGQLTCQGLNRALALPDVLLGKFGTPTYLYAPNPAVQLTDSAGTFYYVRPLATIEPTAIRAVRNVRTKYGYNDIASLEAALITATKANSTIFVAWEHVYLQRVVQNIMNHYGGAAKVPAWISGDYDTLFVVRVQYGSGTTNARFSLDREGLNGQPTACP
jgi:hypothetical protein